MKNSFLAFLTKFDQNHCTIVQGLWANFSATVKKFIKNPILNRIGSNFLHNIRTCMCIRKNYKKGEFSPSHF